MNASCAAFACALIVVGVGSAAHAGDNDNDSSRRIAQIQRALDDAAPGAARWRTGWMIAHAALAVGQGGLALATGDPRRQRLHLVGASESTLGLAVDILSPHPATSAGDELRGIDGSTPEARRAKLARAERLLDDAAAAQSRRRSWLAHAGPIMVAAAGASVLLVGYDQKTDAALSFVGALIGGELQIATAPTAAIEAREVYRSTFTVTVVPFAGGAAILGTF